jgi:hypothetical protein
MGEVVEFPYGFDGQKHMFVGRKSELVLFVPRARYGGRRAVETPTVSAALSLCSQGCTKYEGPILYWIPENVTGVPSDFDWERLFTEAWEAIKDEGVKKTIRARVAIHVTEPVIMPHVQPANPSTETVTETTPIPKTLVQRKRTAK